MEGMAVEAHGEMREVGGDRQRKGYITLAGPQVFLTGSFGG
jgi:hypothetical protein